MESSSNKSGNILNYFTPRWLRYNPEKPFHFGLALNLLFAFSTTFTVANLYYSQPILNQLATAFDVGNERIGRVPTLSQAGYAAGILFISPLGDLARRRYLILLLIVVSTLLTIGLATVQTLAGFEALSFLMGISTVTPQVLLPLVGDLAPPAKRAAALSIVLSGLLLGILVARVIAGIIQFYTTYHVIYYFSIGVQFIILILLGLFLPDYPAKKGHDLNYFGIIWSTIRMIPKYPTLLQSCLIGGLMSAGFLNFWITSTFLLGAKPYHYNSLEIGLFGLLGIAGICTAPVAGRLIDRFVPWHSIIIGITISLTGQLIGLASQFSLGAVIPQIVLMDIGQSSQQIANSSRIYALDPLARSRINACYIIFIFLGQTMGSGVGTRLYTQHGWWASQSFAIACCCTALVILFLRGPWETEDRWLGYSNGLSYRKKKQSMQAKLTSTKEDNQSAESKAQGSDDNAIALEDTQLSDGAKV